MREERNTTDGKGEEMSFRITTYLDDGSALNEVCWEDAPGEAVNRVHHLITCGCRVEKATNISNWSCVIYPPHRIVKITIDP